MAEPKLASSPDAKLPEGEALLPHPTRVMSRRGVVLSVWISGV